MFGQSSFTDLDFADNVSVLVELLELVTTLETMESEAASLGLKVNWQKTKVQTLRCPLSCWEDMPLTIWGLGPRRHGSWGVCLPWLSDPMNNRKHLWHQPPKCHHSCCHAEPRKSDLEVTARYLNEVEAVQNVHLTNIPVWFVCMYDRCAWPVVSAYAAWHQMVPICVEWWCTEANLIQNSLQ